MSGDPITPAWAPLRHPSFRALWFVTVAANVGGLVQDVGAVYAMTTMTNSPTAMALLQLSATVPLFLFALPAGVVTDSGKRRELLLGCTLWVMGASAFLGLLSLNGLLSPVRLLLSITLVELGAAAATPAVETVTPDFVPAAHLQQAVSLGGIGINIARLVGPTAAGFLIATLGPSSVFFFNTVSMGGVLWLLFRRKPPYPKPTASDEPFIQSIKIGFRYLGSARQLLTLLSFSAVFCLFAGAIWPLFPIVVRIELKMGP